MGNSFLPVPISPLNQPVTCSFLECSNRKYNYLTPRHIKMIQVSQFAGGGKGVKYFLSTSEVKFPLRKTIWGHVHLPHLILLLVVLTVCPGTWSLFWLASGSINPLFKDKKKKRI